MSNERSAAVESVRRDAINEAIEVADANLNNFCLPTYSELVDLLDRVVVARRGLYALRVDQEAVDALGLALDAIAASRA